MIISRTLARRGARLAINGISRGSLSPIALRTASRLALPQSTQGYRSSYQCVRLGRSFSSKTEQSPMEFVKEEIAKNDLVVFTKDSCPYCVNLINLFNELGLPFENHRLNLRQDGIDIQRALRDLSGQSTVPNVFKNGVHIGGYTDVVALHKEGKLVSK